MLAHIYTRTKHIQNIRLLRGRTSSWIQRFDQHVQSSICGAPGLHARLPGCWSAHRDLEDPHPRVSFDPVAEEAWRGLSSVLWTNLRGDASRLFEDLPTIQEEGITSRSWEKASTKCRRILFSACLDGDLNLAKVALSTSITPQKQPTFAKCLFAVLSHQYWMLNIEWNWILNWIILNIY